MVQISNKKTPRWREITFNVMLAQQHNSTLNIAWVYSSFMEVNTSEVESFLEMKHECPKWNWMQLSALQYLCLSCFLIRGLLFHICCDFIKGFVWFSRHFSTLHMSTCTLVSLKEHNANCSFTFGITYSYKSLIYQVIYRVGVLSRGNRNVYPGFVVSVLEAHYGQIR